MRDFLYSEIATVHGIANIPDDPDLAIAAGKRLCEDILEPLQSAFGPIAIRSACLAVASHDRLPNPRCATFPTSGSQSSMPLSVEMGGKAEIACGAVTGITWRRLILSLK